MANRAFVRFPNIRIPYYASVFDVFIRLTAHSSLAATPVNLRLGFVAADNPAAPANYAELQALSVAEWITWSGLVAWTDGTAYDSPDLSDSLQEVIDRSGWNSGQAILLVIEDVSSTGWRGWSAIEFDLGSEAAQLFVSYYAREIDLSDSFDGTNGDPPNSKLWRYTFTGTSVSRSYAIQSNKLEAKFNPYSGAFSTLIKMESKWHSSLPLDVSIEFDANTGWHDEAANNMLLQFKIGIYPDWCRQAGAGEDSRFCNPNCYYNSNASNNSPSFTILRQGSGGASVGYMLAHMGGDAEDLKKVDPWAGNWYGTWRIIVWPSGRVQWYLDGVLWFEQYYNSLSGGQDFWSSTMAKPYFEVRLVGSGIASAYYGLWNDFVFNSGSGVFCSDLGYLYDTTTSTTTSSSTTTSCSTTTTTTS